MEEGREGGGERERVREGGREREREGEILQKLKSFRTCGVCTCTYAESIDALFPGTTVHRATHWREEAGA